jgi:class 3 adenylate cyclase/pimeloyl-ACP methyl ester carboxylesterase
MIRDAEVRYARSGDIDIAYKVLGDGPVDLVFVPGFVSHLDLLEDVPFYSRTVEQLASFSRLVTFDKRGTGLSDRSLGFGSTADRMDDIRAVMDAAGLERAALFGVSEGGPLSMLFAATYPERVTKLGLYGTFARILADDGYEMGYSEASVEPLLKMLREGWGKGFILPMLVQNIPPEAIPVVARYERNACTPKMVEEIMRSNFAIDVRDVLSTISTPTFVLHTTGDPMIPVAVGRFLGAGIPDAIYLEQPGNFHGDWNTPGLHPELIEFLSGEHLAPSFDRLLATVLFTDIVSSTEMDVKLGDSRWRDTLDRHDQAARSRIDRYQGRLIKTTGDGLLATFDGPARAIGCAQEIAKATKQIGVDIRAGLHTGEIELRGEDITGLGVVIARRICDLASSGQLLASRTVKDLVTGSGIAFADHGSHTLKGVPDDWQLYAVG